MRDEKCQLGTEKLEMTNDKAKVKQELQEKSQVFLFQHMDSSSSFLQRVW